MCVHERERVCVCQCVCVLCSEPPSLPSHPRLGGGSLINNASFILKSDLTLAAFCLLAEARVRMYRVENKALQSLPPPPNQHKQLNPNESYIHYVLPSIMNRRQVWFEPIG